MGPTGSHDRSSSLGSTGDTAKIWKIWTWWNCCGCQASCLQAKQSAPVAHHGKKSSPSRPRRSCKWPAKKLQQVSKSLRPQGSSMVLWQHKAQFNQFSQRCKLDESSKIGTTWTWPAIRDWCLLSVISHPGWTPFQILSESWKVVGHSWSSALTAVRLIANGPFHQSGLAQAAVAGNHATPSAHSLVAGPFVLLYPILPNAVHARCKSSTKVWVNVS